MVLDIAHFYSAHKAILKKRILLLLNISKSICINGNIYNLLYNPIAEAKKYRHKKSEAV